MDEITKKWIGGMGICEQENNDIEYDDIIKETENLLFINKNSLNKYYNKFQQIKQFIKSGKQNKQRLEQIINGMNDIEKDIKIIIKNIEFLME